MLNAPELRKIKSSGGRDEGDLLVLFRESAVEMVLRFIDSTEAGKKREKQRTRNDLTSGTWACLIETTPKVCQARMSKEGRRWGWRSESATRTVRIVGGL